MANGIAKGIARQLGQLGSDIVTEVVKTPAKIAGFDTGTQETKGAGTGGKVHGQAHVPTKQPQEQIDLGALRQKDEIEKQKHLARVRQELAQQFKQSTQKPEETLEHQRKMEELQKEQEEIERMKADAKILRFGSSKPKRGNLFGKLVKKQKTFGSEQSKNAVHQ